jgi:hypothetical protein
MDRRNVLKGALAASISALAADTAKARDAKTLARDPLRIPSENQSPGAIDWQLTYIRLERPTGYRSLGIEGYCSRQSVAAGETIDIMVSADPPGQYTIEIFRMGYYGGCGARLMTTLGPFEGRPQPLPEVGARRLRECRWDPATTLTIPDDWTSGVYLGRLSRAPTSDGTDPWQSYVVFVVRDDRPADILFQCSDNTWQAYNRWPTRFSLYDDGSAKDWTSLPEIDVSFDRPYGKYRQIYENPQSVGSGEFLLWEFPLCYWLEQHGYDVTYCSQSDMLTPDCALRAKTLISVGHDEYWDVRAYESVRKLVEHGVNVLFLSGNTMCWVTPFSPSSDGRPNRIITRAAPYKGLTMGENSSVRERFTSVGPDEGLLLGARNIVPVNGGGDWIVTLPEHWMFEGTGMKRGDRIPGLVGWEFHGMPAEIAGLEVVASGHALHSGTTPTPWTATIYPGPKGNFVFNASTIYWAQGLSSPPGHMLPYSHNTRPHGPDPRVQQIMQNLLRRSLSS